MNQQTLYPKKWKKLLLLVLSITLTTVSGWLALDGDTIGELGFIFFGLAVALSLINLHPKATYLKLDEEGFEMCTAFRKRKLRWDEVVGFGVMTISLNKVVTFTLSEDYLKARKAPVLSSVFPGTLPDAYGFKAVELAALMNEYKRHSDSRQTDDASKTISAHENQTLRTGDSR